MPPAFKSFEPHSASNKRAKAEIIWAYKGV